MIKDWWQQQIGIKEVCGVEFIFDESSEMKCQICHLKLVKKSVSLILQKTELSLGPAIEILRKIKVPISINFSGDGIITRVVPIGVQGEEVSLAFPGMDKEKFYTQKIVQVKTAIISLVNKKAVDGVLEELGNLQILNISLAGLVPLNLGLRGTDSEDELAFGGHHLLFKDDELYKYDFLKGNVKKEHIKFNQVKVDTSIFNAYSQAFQVFFYPQLSPVGIESWHNELAIYYKKNTLKLLGMIFTAFILGALMFNFLIWNNLNQQARELNSVATFKQSMVSGRDGLFSDIKRREESVKNLGILPLPHQYVHFQIGKAVPSGISLLSVDIQPTSSEGLTYGEIVINGVMNNVKAYERLKTNLQQTQFFSITSESFKYKESSKTTNFELRIRLFER